MNGQADRCDRTAYVSGLQPTISDIELFEVFNRVAHVEKVIVRNGVCRHALVVFKTVQGLYMVLVHFQGHFLHGRQLHIRPLRESSHANSETITTMFEKAKNQGQTHNRRPASVQERFTPTSSPFVPSTDINSNRNQTARGYRNSSGSYGRRRSGYSKNNLVNETYSNHQMFDNTSAQTHSMHGDNFHFEDYTEGAKRFDSLANLIRSSTPTDPFTPYQRDPKLSDSNSGIQKCEPRSRVSSARDQSVSKTVPPTWKMELQIKKNEAEALKSPDIWKIKEKPAIPSSTSDGSMSAQEFLVQYAQANQITPNEQAMKKKRPNLSVINPSLFYEQYPRTSSPVTFASSKKHDGDRVSSPHDPAVLAYSRLKAPQSAFAGLSPIDTNNCSFITKHLGTLCDNGNIEPHMRRDMTNDELSDMIVSTGNLRINPTAAHSCNLYENLSSDGPAPWSPVKRLRAESGSLSTAQFTSPQFSPIKSKSSEFNETEDEVFSSENKYPFGGQQCIVPEMKQLQNGNGNNVLSEQNMQNYDDINNSRLPSNSHSANPNSEKKAFVFPDYPLCRHSSVPSIAHLVNDLSDFGPLSPHVTAGAKLSMDQSSILREYQSFAAGKLWETTESFGTPNEGKQNMQHQPPTKDIAGM